MSVQISAYISEDTKCQIEAYSKKSGIKKGFLIEDALLHHLQALREIPQDIIIPSRITLSESEMEALVEQLELPPKPTAKLMALMADER